MKRLALACLFVSLPAWAGEDGPNTSPPSRSYRAWSGEVHKPPRPARPQCGQFDGDELPPPYQIPDIAPPRPIPFAGGGPDEGFTPPLDDHSEPLLPPQGPRPSQPGPPPLVTWRGALGHAARVQGGGRERQCRGIELGSLIP